MDPDQLASQKPADLDLHCFQTEIFELSMVRVYIGGKMKLFLG